MKSLTITAVLLVLTAAAHPSKKDQSSEFAQNNTPDKAEASSFYVSNQTTYPKTGDSEPKSQPGWKNPEWWLFAIAVPTLLYVGKQARSTADAAKATLKSVKLQEAQLRQWVDIDDWDCHIRNLVEGIDNTLVVSFWICNATKMLMTLKTVNITTSGYGAQALSYPNLLPPGKKYQQEIPITIRDNAHIEALRMNKFVLTINADVGFDDAFGGSPKQHFRIVLVCGITKCDVTEDQRTYDYD